MRPVLLALLALFGVTAARAEIVIGLGGPVTGSSAAFGEQMRRGAEAAVAALNAQGGVLGQPLRLVVADDACEPDQARTAAAQLAEAGAVVAIGHFCSSASIPAAAVYDEEGVLMISPASTNPALTDEGRWNVFRTCGRDDQQGATAAAFIARQLAGKTIAVAHDKQTYSAGLADETIAGLRAAGIEPVLIETINPGEQDYSAFVTRLKGANPDYLFFGGYHREAGLIVRQMREQGLATALIGGDALVTQEYWAVTGPAGEGTLMTFSPDPAANPANAPILAAFQAQNYAPEGYTLYTYGAIQAWAQAATAAGTTDPEKVADALRAGRFQTVLGEIGFDAKGDVSAPGYVMYRWSNGTYTVVEGQ